MDIRFATEGKGDVVAVMAAEGKQLLPAAQALDAQTGGRITRAIEAGRFNGGAGQAIDLVAPDGVDFGRILVIGIGNLERGDGLAVERWAAHAVKRVLISGATKLVLQPDAFPGVAKAEAGAHAAFGARMATYRFDSYRTKLKPDQTPSLEAVEIVAEAPAAARSRYEKD